MSAIEPYAMDRCIKCITFVLAEDSDNTKQKVVYRRYPDLGELVETFGSRAAWKIVQEWPENGALLHECNKCHHKWITHTGDELFIDPEGMENNGN